MLASIQLELQGSQRVWLLASLLAATSAALIAVGVVQWVRRRRFRSAAALSAALTPVVFAPVMLAVSWLAYREGDASRGRRAWVAAVVSAAGLALAAAAVTWSQTTWAAILTAATGLQVAMAIGVFYAGAFTRLGGGRFSVLLILRCVAVAALLSVLARPALSILPDERTRKAPLPFVVDRSASMAVAEGEGPPRYGQAAEMLLSQAPRLGEHLEATWVLFAEAPRVAGIEAVGALSPPGDGTAGTDIAAALRAAATAAPQAQAVVLITDGNDTSGRDVLAAAGALGRTVHVVGIGALTEPHQARRNAELVGVEAPLTAIANHVVTIRTETRLTGLANTAAEIQLAQADRGGTLSSQPLWASQDDQTLQAKLTWTAQWPGGDATGPVAVLAVAVPNLSGETDVADNAAEVHVLVTRPTLRVLYVEGAVRPEYKFLYRHLSGDPNVELVSLLRVTAERFWSRGSAAGQKLDHLPATTEQWALFDAVIVGDAESDLWTTAQLQQLAAFVDDGGGLLMLGGQRSLVTGGYDQTALAPLLPVRLGSPERASVVEAFVPRLTGEGQRHSIFGGIAERFTTEGLPELTGCAAVRGAKATAKVLAVHPTASIGGGPAVVLAVQSFGAGRAAVLTADTTWRWALPLRAQGQDGPYERFWSQMVRWLAGFEGPDSDQTGVAARLTRTTAPAGREIDLRAAAATGQSDPTGVEVAYELRRADDDAPVATGRMAAAEGDIYAATLAPPAPGDYRLTVRATAADGRALGEDALPLRIAEPMAETEHLARNDSLLRELADRTGGRYVELSALPDLVDVLIASAPPAGLAAATVHSLTDFPAAMVVFIVALTVEWLLRRRWELT